MVSRITSATFTNSGSWIAPAGITSVWISGCGGGGGGGGGKGGTNNPSQRFGEGGGGAAAAPFQTNYLSTVVPGTTYTITIGAGGTGGTGGTGSASGGLGLSGGTSSFGSSFITFRGGAGAGPGASSGDSRGGLPSGLLRENIINSVYTLNLDQQSGAGGTGSVAGGSASSTPGLDAQAGIDSVTTQLGGAAGVKGTDDGTSFGGGGGGGGGASSFGAGGAGGAGGNGSASGTAQTGHNGGVGTSFGAGGGGGGGGGASVLGTLGGGGNGGNGGPGIIIVSWVV